MSFNPTSAVHSTLHSIEDGKDHHIEYNVLRTNMVLSRIHHLHSVLRARLISLSQFSQGRNTHFNCYDMVLRIFLSNFQSKIYYIYIPHEALWTHYLRTTLNFANQSRFHRSWRNDQYTSHILEVTIQAFTRISWLDLRFLCIVSTTQDAVRDTTHNYRYNDP